MPEALRDRHVLVTGGGTGIGAAVACALAAVGARVSIAGRRMAVLEATAASLGANRGAIATIDVTNEASIASGLRHIESTVGPVDILVNNAGQATSAAFAKTSTAALEDMMAVNFYGTWHMTQALLPGMLARGSGRVINIASTAGLIGYQYVAAYVAAKHAVIGLTRALALEVARKGITVNAVCPGFTETPLLEASVATIIAKTGRAADAARAELARTNPSGRLVRPEEVADAVVWLASPGASAINGQAIAVACGEVMTG